MENIFELNCPNEQVTWLGLLIWLKKYTYNVLGILNSLKHITFYYFFPPYKGYLPKHITFVHLYVIFISFAVFVNAVIGSTIFILWFNICYTDWYFWFIQNSLNLNFPKSKYHIIVIVCSTHNQVVTITKLWLQENHR